MKTHIKNNIDDHIDERTLVTILLDNEMFGIDVSKVHEITGLPEVSFVPNAAEYMRGVINLRGKVIPLIDLRTKFKLPNKEYDKLTVVMICEIKKNLVGMIVDSVSDVVDVSVHDVQDTPHFTTSIDADCIDGIIQIDGQIIVIIDVDKIFTDDELEKME